MGIILFLYLTLAQSLAYLLPGDNGEWETFKIKYSKEYSTLSEETRRRDIFLKNLEHVKEHNSKYVKGEVSYNKGINIYSDLTDEEFSAHYKGFQPSPENENDKGRLFSYPTGTPLPASIDWRERGAVTPVKNQAQCGSCWAFSAVGCLEGQHFLKSNQLVSLSEQNLLDCAPNNGCQGGGTYYQAFSYVIQNGGIDTEDSYPYEGCQDSCRYNPSTIGATAMDIVSIQSGNETDLQVALAIHGPISVAFDVIESFKHYNGDVFEDPDCSSKNINHAVVVVGYGTTQEGKDYWLVKNSWGPNWGIQGYFMMARNKNNMCGIATAAMFPVV